MALDNQPGAEQPVDSQPIKEEPIAINGSADQWPDPPPDRQRFLEDLQDFHTQRGSMLDPNPKVHGKPVDLYDLFQNIQARGGYDKVSAEKLLWRKIAGEFELNQHHAAASAFGVKTVYYKNLAAYAIKRVHKKEPPPKEILEDLTAKGGDLLSRSTETFRTPQRHEHITNGNESEASDGDNSRTPKPDRMDIDEPASGERRSRGLRQAPPQRVLFQPDVSSSRQSRQNQAQSTAFPSGSHLTPGLAPNPSLNNNSNVFYASKYDPRTSIPLTFRGLMTPSSNPIEFQRKAQQLQEARLANAAGLINPRSQFMAPGTGFPGPNIYIRALNALRSGIDEEETYALHHLVKISHERGDKFRFESFIGFAEGLIEQGLKVGSLFYDVDWKISWMGYAGEEINNIDTLDGIDGTLDILDRIKKLTPLDVPDELQPYQFRHKLQKCLEAGLVLRNMAMLEDNARYLSESWPMRDLLSIILSLPPLDCVIELKHYALDVAEQLTKFWTFEANDPLYTLLLQQLEDGQDRGAILTSLRAICRISMNLEEPNRLQNISMKVITSLMDWTLLEDDELVESCLDFFYQYTAVSENVATVLNKSDEGEIPLGAFIRSLGRLLLHNSNEIVSKRLLAEAQEAEPNDDVLEVPQDLLEQLITIAEPERSSTWLRACFEEHPDSYMTQIKLWQAYQNRFQLFSNPAKPLLQAAEFIKNISATFTGTSAQVVTTESPPKFIIKGIRPRRTPKDTKGRNYLPCLWVDPNSKDACGSFYLKPEQLFEHIIKHHIGLSRNASTDKWEFEKVRRQAKELKRKFNCHWANCHHFAATKGVDSPYKVGMHVKTHLPDHSDMAAERAKHNGIKRRRRSDSEKNIEADKRFEKFIGGDLPPIYQEFGWQNTANDERGNATGLPLTAVLVLRNLARTVPTAVSGVDGDRSTKEWMELLFIPSKDQYFHVMAVNRVLAPNIFDLLETIEKGMEG